MNQTDISTSLYDIYHRLYTCFGPQHWWPGETPFEVMVGAILTQSASWHNVEIAIASLKQAGALTPGVLREISMDELGKLIHSSGYYNAKAKKLRALAEWLGGYRDDLDEAFAGELNLKRSELLGIHGIGPETADSILLYAAGKPVFVIDAYTKRTVDRIGMAPKSDSYDAYQRLFTSNIEQDARLFNEYHALFVKLGKDMCSKKALCQVCPLKAICVYGRERR